MERLFPGLRSPAWALGDWALHQSLRHGRDVPGRSSLSLRLERGKQRSCQVLGVEVLEWGKALLGGHFAMSRRTGRGMEGMPFHIFPFPSQVIMLPAWTLRIPDSGSCHLSGDVSSSICPPPEASLVIVQLDFLDTELFILPKVLEGAGAVYVTCPLKCNSSEFELKAFI